MNERTKYLNDLQAGQIDKPMTKIDFIDWWYSGALYQTYRVAVFIGAIIAVGCTVAIAMGYHA